MIKGSVLDGNGVYFYSSTLLIELNIQSIEDSVPTYSFEEIEIPVLICSEQDLDWSFTLPNLAPEPEEEFEITFEPLSELQKHFIFDEAAGKIEVKPDILEDQVC